MAKIVMVMGPKMKGKDMKKKMEEEILLEDLPGMEEEDDFAEEDMVEEDDGLDMDFEDSEDGDIISDLASTVSEEEIGFAKDLMSALKADDAEGFSMALKDFLSCSQA